MANYYADSSALVKMHVPEAGSAWMQALADHQSGNAILTAHLTLVEMFSALNRRVREGSINVVDYAAIATAVKANFFAQYGIIPLSQSVIDDAIRILERHNLRAYDSVQLASAIQSQKSMLSTSAAAPIFLSADDRLLKAAQAEGFVTDNPNLH